MKILCTACQTKSSVRGKPRGSVIIELFLWIFLIIPGVIYTIWRAIKPIYICPHCDCKVVKKIEKDDKDIFPPISFLGIFLITVLFIAGILSAVQV